MIRTGQSLKAELCFVLNPSILRSDATEYVRMIQDTFVIFHQSSVSRKGQCVHVGERVALAGAIDLDDNAVMDLG